MCGGFWRSRKRIGLLGAVLVASVMVAVLLTRGSAVADVTTWTIDADFDEGTLQGVNHDAPNQDQLQLNETGSTFPFLWIANAGEDTVSKIGNYIFDFAGERACAGQLDIQRKMCLT